MGAGCCKTYKPPQYPLYLPQKDPQKELRDALLIENCKVYEYRYDDNGIPPYIKNMPKDELFPTDTKIDFVGSSLRGAVNEKLHSAWSLLDPIDSLEDFDDFYVLFKTPGIAGAYMTDYSFAAQRTGGCNPYVISLVKKALPEGCVITDKDVKHILGKTTLKDLIKKKKLYICDYQDIYDMTLKPGCYGGCPFALFYIDDADGEEPRLMPLAIQLERTVGPLHDLRFPPGSLPEYKMTKKMAESLQADLLDGIDVRSDDLSQDEAVSGDGDSDDEGASEKPKKKAASSKKASSSSSKKGGKAASASSSKKGKKSSKKVESDDEASSAVDEEEEADKKAKKKAASSSKKAASSSKKAAASGKKASSKKGKEASSKKGKKTVDSDEEEEEEQVVSEEEQEEEDEDEGSDEADEEEEDGGDDAEPGSAAEDGDDDGERPFVFTPPSVESRKVGLSNTSRDEIHRFVSTPEQCTWVYAKMMCQNADAQLHQFKYHLCFTHLFCEVFYIGLNRSLSPRHPLYNLLHPHFFHTLAINDAARRTLIAPKGAIDQTFAAGYQGALETVRRAWGNYDFQKQAFYNDAEARGVPALPNSYWYEDAAMVHQAINTYIHTIVYHYYDDNKDIKADKELQALLVELASDTGGRVKNLPKVKTPDDLTDFLTQVVFIATCGHAAINFSQWDYMSFVPNYPLALHEPAPKSKNGIKDEETIVKALPLQKEAAFQILFANLLVTPSPSELGHIREDTGYDFANDVFKIAQQTWQDNLNRIKAHIDSENKKRTIKYPYCLPPKIPNSIAI